MAAGIVAGMGARPAEARDSYQPVYVDSAFAKTIAGNQQFTLLGDSDHSNLEIRSFIARETTMATLRAQGITKLFIEFPPELSLLGVSEDFQKMGDAAAKGDISRDAFIKFISASAYQPAFQYSTEDKQKTYGITADIFINAGKNGIRVICADTDPSIIMNVSNSKYPMLRQMSNDFQKGMQVEMANEGIKPGALQSQQLPAISTKVQEKMFERYTPTQVHELGDEFWSERLNWDQQVAASIIRQSGNEKSAVFYGVMHLLPSVGGDTPGVTDKSGGFYDLLGPSKSRMIAIVGDGRGPFTFSAQDGWKEFKIASQPSTDTPSPESRKSLGRIAGRVTGRRPGCG